jgi:two-component system, NtrC family, response regulator AtoC
MPETTLLLVDDDKSVLSALKMTLEGEYALCTAENGANALELLREREPDLVLLDIGLPDISGIDLIGQIKSVEPEVEVIMVTAVEETRMVVKALKLGAYDYLVKPIDAQELKVTIQNALEARRLKDKIRRIQKPNIERYRFELIGKSPQIKALIETVQRVAGSRDTPVLITGETGTGKGVLARTIHYSSPEFPGPGPFVSVNCSAITHDLFESELFGYERGAFTGAKAEGRIGRFEEASGGTLFLDEIGSMSLPTQSKLLGVLDERTFQRVGGSRSRHVSARIIAATNTELQKAVEEGQFRRDLFFRLNVVSIHVPPLRERLDDIMPLTEHFIGLFNKKFGKRFNRIAPEMRKALLNYPWPGNVRELRNVLERIILLENGSTLLPHHLAPLQTETGLESSSRKPAPMGLPDYEETIKRLIQEALEKSRGNVLEASRLLNMPPHKMRYRMKKYGLKGG